MNKEFPNGSGAEVAEGERQYLQEAEAEFGGERDNQNGPRSSMTFGNQREWQQKDMGYLAEKRVLLNSLDEYLNTTEKPVGQAMT